VMVVSLLLRGVSFEFRLKAHGNSKLWDRCFFLGSLSVAFVQGTVLGAFVQGFHLPTVSNADALTFYQWLSPFSLTCGAALVFGYVLLGSNRLIAKTTGHLQERCFKISNIVQYVIILFAVVISAWSPFLDPNIKARWFNPQYMPYLAILPAFMMGLFFEHRYGFAKRDDHLPFWCSVGVFLTCYLGFIISSYPYLVPRHITYLQAAAGRSTLLFMTVGACIMLPILLYYTYYSYRIFRGKVTEKIEH